MKKKFFKFLAVYTVISLVSLNFAFFDVKEVKADEPDDLISITTCEGLQLVGSGEEGYPLDGDYILDGSYNGDTERYEIDCSATVDWNSSDVYYCSDNSYLDESSCTSNDGEWTFSYTDNLGFDPIGDSENPFTGTLNGNNVPVVGLNIYREDENNVGLFSFLSSSAEVYDLYFEDFSISGANNVGLLAGTAQSGVLIENVHAEYSNDGFYDINAITEDGSDGSSVGGLVGSSSAAIASSSFSGQVTGNFNIGGIAGYMNNGSISNSYVSATLETQGENIENIGGLVGYSDNSNISSSYFIGSIGGNDASNAGGLAGSFSNGTIKNSYIKFSKSKSSIFGYHRVGGLVGKLSTSTLMYGYSDMEFSMFNDANHISPSEFGGLVGYSYNSTILKSYSGNLGYDTSIISAPWYVSYVGGLIGRADKTSISNTYSNFSVEGVDYLGGLVGSLENDSSVINSYSVGSSTASIPEEATSIGGLVGSLTDSSVTHSYYDSAKSGMSDTGKGQAKTTGKLKKESTFSNWDFTNNWEMIGGYYPTLRSVASDNFDPIVGEVYVKSTWHEEYDFSEEDIENIDWYSNAFNNIPEALEEVAEGGIIYLLDNGLGDNVFDFDLSDSITVNKAVSIIGETLSDDNKVTVGSINSSSVFWITSSDVTIENLNISKVDHAVSVMNGIEDVYVKNNVMRDNHVGVYVDSAVSVYIEDNELENNIYALSIANLLGESNVYRNKINNNYRGMNITNFNGGTVDVRLNQIYDNGLSDVDLDNNDYYDGDDYNTTTVANRADIIIQADNSIDFSRNWWGDKKGPSFYKVDSSDGTTTFEIDHISGNNESIVAFSSNDEDHRFRGASLFRPFCKNAGCTQFSNMVLSMSSDDTSLLSLFLPYSSSAVFLSNEVGSTTVSNINIREETIIEIPVANNMASTTITLASSTIIAKASGGTFAYQDLSAAEMATNALSGFESGELIGALQWGIPSIGLSFSSPVTIEMYVGTELSGQTIELYRSTSVDGGWTKDGLLGSDGAENGTCLVSEAGMCKFQTTLASYFGALKASSSDDDDNNDDDSSSGGSFSPISLPSGIGSGARDIPSTFIGATLNAGEIGRNGVNFLTYITNQNNFSTGESSNAWKLANHRFVINSLNLDTNEAVITFYSDPKIVNIKKGETKNVDLDGDKINDIQVTFSNIYVNRAEITVKSLSNNSSVISEPISNVSTAETIKITNDNLYNRLKGKILLKVEDSGKAYYVSPTKKEMYYLGRPADAFSVMRGQGVGITNANLNKILVNKAKTNSKIDAKFTKAHLGKIFIQTELNGEAWYVNPSDSSRYYLGRPADAFSIMRKLGLGISNANFSLMSK